MKLTSDIEAVRVHGALTVELADGRQGTLDVDLDVENYGTGYEIRHEWPEFISNAVVRPIEPIATRYSIRIERPRQERPLFKLTVPVEGD